MNLKGQKAVVTGGSRGLGLGVVEALVSEGAEVTVVARNPKNLAALSQRLGVNTVSGDAKDASLAQRILSTVKPTVLILCAGETPVMGRLHELSWIDFNRVWENDVQSSFVWIKEALALPLAPGSRVIVGSSGAALKGSPLSGSYAGAKRMQWFMTEYANEQAKDLGLEITFQAIVPMQIIGETELGMVAASAYAKDSGISVDELLAGFGAPLPPRLVGEHVVSILTDSAHSGGSIFGMKGDLGLISLDD